jgi:DNA-binding CsgD family transcriptional regulator
MKRRNPESVNKITGLVWVGIGVALIFWISESALHAYFYRDANISAHLLPPNMHEIWMRFLVICIFIIFGAYAQFIINQRRRVEKELRRERDNIVNILNSMKDGVYVANQHCDIDYINPALKKEFGLLEVTKCYEYFNHRNEVCDWCKNQEVFDGKTVHWEWKSPLSGKTYDLIDTPFYNPNGEVSKLSIFRDISQRKQAEEKLRERESELEAKSNDLEAANSALQVLLKQVKEDKRESEENVLSNVKQLVFPHLEKLKRNPLNEDQKTLIDLLESNLKNIISPFASKLSSDFFGLSPMEIRVADLITQWKTNKEIADVLNVSENTILFHRKRIRAKLNLKHKKVNLRSYLLSLK